MFENLLQDGLWIIILAGLLPLTLAMICGLVVGVLQSATQIQEQSTAFIIKLIVVAVVIFIISPILKDRLISLVALAIGIMSGT